MLHNSGRGAQWPRLSFSVVPCALSIILMSDQVHSADISPSSLRLQQAVEVALQNNPTILQAAEEMREAEAVGKLAFSKSLPTISGTLQYKRQKDSTNNTRPRFDGDSYNFYSGELQFSQTLLQRGYFSALSAGGDGKPLRALDFEIARRNLTFTVIQAFYKVLLATRQVSTLRKAEAIHRQSLEAAEHRSKIGRGQLLDVLQVKTQLALLAPRIEKAENDQKSSVAELANHLGRAERHDLDIVGKFEIPTFKILESKIKSLQPEVPELRKIKLLEEQFSDTKTVSLGKHWPQLNAVGNIERTGFAFGDLGNSSSTAWSAGLQLSIPFFTGLSYFFEKQSLNSQELSLHLEETKLRNQISLDQLKSREDLLSAESVIRSSAAAYDLAAQAVKEAKRQYRVATIDYLVLLSTEQSLLEAELALDEAKFGAIELMTKYFTSIGYPPEILVELLGS